SKQAIQRCTATSTVLVRCRGRPDRRRRLRVAARPAVATDGAGHQPLRAADRDCVYVAHPASAGSVSTVRCPAVVAGLRTDTPRGAVAGPPGRLVAIHRTGLHDWRARPGSGEP